MGRWQFYIFIAVFSGPLWCICGGERMQLLVLLLSAQVLCGASVPRGGGGGGCNYYTFFAVFSGPLWCICGGEDAIITHFLRYFQVLCGASVAGRMQLLRVKRRMDQQLKFTVTHNRYRYTIGWVDF
jgi:hypothetical protein